MAKDIQLLLASICRGSQSRDKIARLTSRALVISHARTSRGSRSSSAHVTVRYQWFRALGRITGYFGVPWLLSSSLTVAVRRSFSFVARARELRSASEFLLVEPVCQGTIIRTPTTSVTLLREMRVGDASDIELLWKSLTDRQGPWQSAYGYSSMLIRPSCPFLLASSCHIYRPLCRLCTSSSVPTVLCTDISVRNAKEDLVVQASARHR
jgi:hypothetical protein